MMKALRLDGFSERQQVMTIIGGAAAVIAILTYFLLWPQLRERRAIRKQISTISAKLAKSTYATGEVALSARRAALIKNRGVLDSEWTNIVAQVGAFPAETALTNPAISTIEYKMALFDVRENLGRKATEVAISLPPGLGMRDTVDSSEDPRQLMLQLRALEKLVDLAIDIRIEMLRHVTPLPPIRHKIPGKEDEFVEEYPLHIEFYGSLQNLYDFLHETLEPGRVFALKHLLVEAASANNAELLNIDAVMSAIVFMIDPTKINPPPKRKRRTAPMGY